MDLAATAYGVIGSRSAEALALEGATFIEFSATTRMSGVDLPDGARVRKGAGSAVAALVRETGGAVPAQVQEVADHIGESGGTPLVVADQQDGKPARVLGVVHLKDIVKPGMRERFDHMRRMGIRTVMITGDNPLTAAAIAREAGVDDFLAEAHPRRRCASSRPSRRVAASSR